MNNEWDDSLLNKKNSREILGFRSMDLKIILIFI